MPSPRSALFVCHTPHGFGLVLAGSMTTAQFVHMREGDAKVGVWLRPGSRYLFQPFELGGLRDQVVVLRDLNNSVIDTHEERILDADTPKRQAELLQQCVRQLIDQGLIVRDKMIDQAVARVYELDGQAKVANITPVGLSYRQFVRRCHTFTGYSPKGLLRAQRLHVAAQQLDSSSMSIAQLAVDHGYADHAHFTREFREVIKVIPSDFTRHQSI